jgi:hypothetical protein
MLWVSGSGLLLYGEELVSSETRYFSISMITISVQGRLCPMKAGYHILAVNEFNTA